MAHLVFLLLNTCGITLFFSLFHIRWRGARWSRLTSSLLTRWRYRTEIGRGRPDWDGLVWETEGLSERGSGGGGAFLLTFVGPDLVLLRPRHETAWELLPLVSAPAFASFFFSWLPTTPDNGARGAALTFVVATFEQAAPLVTSPSRFSFRKLFKDLGRDSLLLSSLMVSFLPGRLQDNHKGTVNSSHQNVLLIKEQEITLWLSFYELALYLSLPWKVMKFCCSYFVNGVSNQSIRDL